MYLDPNQARCLRIGDRPQHFVPLTAFYMAIYRVQDAEAERSRNPDICPLRSAWEMIGHSRGSSIPLAYHARNRTPKKPIPLATSEGH